MSRTEASTCCRRAASAFVLRDAQLRLHTTAETLTPIQEPLVLENRHSRERLELRRLRIEGELCLELRGSLPPHSEGPPLHIHFAEHETGTVIRGVLTAWVDGRRIEARPGEPAELPKGSAHRWWNEGDATLEFIGYAKPVVDLDQYLQAVFDIVNASPSGRPSLVYLAHVARRHRSTQAMFIMPRLLQAILLQGAYLLGKVTGRYRGNDWPGAPSRCAGAPAPVAEEA